MNDQGVSRIEQLAEALKNCRDDRERIACLDRDYQVRYWQSPGFESDEKELIIKSLVAIGEPWLSGLWESLCPVEKFYKEIGGIVGYHGTLISFLSQGGPLHPSGTFHRPPAIDISSDDQQVRTFINAGIASLPYLAEIYPVGGAADRLKLSDPASGQPLPAAKLNYCGLTLLEWLVRDVQAREYLYFKLNARQITIPIAMMTSAEKDNHEHILSLCRENQWFGRPEDSFRFFCQPLVPTIDKQGHWCTIGRDKLLMKPGGHGVLWKLAEQEGIFEWMKSLGKEKILVRQINNPIAGTDYGLLAFCGIGFEKNKVFGFASCPRQVGSAEGVNILIERGGSCSLTNIEYCDFAKYMIEDVPIEPGSSYSQFPSNTNILFADIAGIQQAAIRCPIPGMLINLKSTTFTDEEGNVQSVEMARLESTMQNIADCLDAAQTYLTYNHRRKTISTTKKLYQKDGSLLETPEGCLYDQLHNAHDLLTNYCRASVPDVPGIEDYLLHGPSFLFSYHPAFGPLYSIIAKKLRGGKWGHRSELKLEIAEADIENITLSGSLHVIAVQPLGEKDLSGIVHYSDKVGRCRLKNVMVENRGIDADAGPIYWKGEIPRHELCEIVIYGNGEFVAENVTLRGNLKICVRSGTRQVAIEENGTLKLYEELL